MNKNVSAFKINAEKSEDVVCINFRQVSEQLKQKGSPDHPLYDEDILRQQTL